MQIIKRKNINNYKQLNTVYLKMSNKLLCISYNQWQCEQHNTICKLFTVYIIQNYIQNIQIMIFF